MISPALHIFEPKWWNWQTRKIQDLVGATPWGFESPLRHHTDSWSLKSVTLNSFQGLMRCRTRFSMTMTDYKQILMNLPAAVMAGY